jgi:hypothetical protein
VQFRPPGELVAVSYESRRDSFVTGKPRVWSSKIALFTATGSYEAAPDGTRIVVLLPTETSKESPDRLIFLLNFFDELRRRLPAS